MALKTFKPYTKSTRGTILVNREGLWKGKPFKGLVSPKNAMKGRNNNGHITSINRAGGHKKMYRHVDFYRKKFEILNCLIILDKSSKETLKNHWGIFQMLK